MTEKRHYFWRVYLLPRSGWKAVLLLPALSLAGLWGFYLGGVSLLILAIILLVFSLRDFLFPLTYNLNSERIEMRGFLLSVDLRWEDIEEIESEGGILLIYPKRGDTYSRRLKPFPVYLNGNKEEIWEKIESYWKRSS